MARLQLIPAIRRFDRRLFLLCRVLYNGEREIRKNAAMYHLMYTAVQVVCCGVNMARQTPPNYKLHRQRAHRNSADPGFKPRLRTMREVSRQGIFNECAMALFLIADVTARHAAVRNSDAPGRFR